MGIPGLEVLTEQDEDEEEVDEEEDDAAAAAEVEGRRLTAARGSMVGGWAA